MSRSNIDVEVNGSKLASDSKASFNDVPESKDASVSVVTMDDIGTEKLDLLSPNNKHACNYCYENRRKVYSNLRVD